MASNLIAVIREKQLAIAKLQAELDEALTLLSGASTGTHGRTTRPDPILPTVAARVKSSPRTRRNRTGVKAAKGEIIATSSVGRMVTVLERAGKPIHIDDAIRQIEAEGHQVNKATLVGNLSRYIKDKRVFYRAAPSVFGLIAARKG